MSICASGRGFTVCLLLFSTFNHLTRSLREPGGPCTKSMKVSESRMEWVNHTPSTGVGFFFFKPDRLTERRIYPIINVKFSILHFIVNITLECLIFVWKTLGYAHHCSPFSVTKPYTAKSNGCSHWLSSCSNL